MSLVGTTVGSIRIDAQLGRGGMGEVYQAFDLRLERPVAVKCLRAEQRLSGEQKARFRREARLLSRLGHPAICRIYELIETPGADLLVLELVPGRTLRDLMRARVAAGGAEPRRASAGVAAGDDAAAGSLGLDRVLQLGEQIAAGLAAAHEQRVVHRDVKAENIMVTPRGEVKILDFGVARLVDDGGADERPSSADELPASGSGTAAPPTDDAPAAGSASADPAPSSFFSATTLALAAHEPQATVASPASGRTAPPPSAPASGEHEPRAHDGGLTAAGFIVGTLATMSPEQARGERVDEASDMYSFGILLQELVTGEPAYESTSRMQLLQRVLRGQTRPLVDVDADLARLIQDLQSLDPRRRPTAADTVERLAWVRDKPRRQRLRRLRLAGIAAAFAVLLVMLAVVTRLALVASRANDEAQRRRGAAEELIAFMIGDLHGRLEGVGRLDVLDEVGERAMAYFAALPEEELTPVDLRHRVIAIRQIGAVRDSQGDAAAAMVAFRRAEDLARRAAAAHPDDVDMLLEFVATLDWVGQIHFDRGDVPAAKRVWREALDDARHAAGRAPDSVAALRAVAIGEHNLASAVDALGEPAALGLYQQSLEHARRVAAADPKDVQIHGLMGATLAWVSNAQEKSGDVAAALVTRREHVRIFERLAAEHPGDAHRQEDAATARGFVANLVAPFGDAAEARRLYASGLQTIAALAARDPENLSLRRWECAFERALGRFEQEQGNVEAARAHLERAVALGAQLVAKDPEEPDWRMLAATSRLRLAAAGNGDDDRARAAAAARQALAPLADFLAAPDGGSARAQAAESLVTLGSLEAAAGDAAAARRAWERALAVAGHGGPPADDWRLLVWQSAALLRLDRNDEAAPLVARLQRLGYRSPEWLALCRSKGVLAEEPPAERVAAAS